MKHNLMGYCICTTAKEGGRIVVASLLSLLFPLSFLLLARQSTVRFLSSTSDNVYTIPNPNNNVSFLCSIFFGTEATALVSFLVCMISAKAFLHGLPFRVLPVYYWPPRFYMNAAFLIVCTMLVFVVLGLQGSVDAGISDYVLVVETPMVRRLLFCVGLYETMIFWWKNVVDESFSVGLGGAEFFLKAAMGLSFGGLWWWWLMEEVEALAVVPLAMQLVGVLDFAAWGVYSLMVMHGIVKVLVTSYMFYVLVLINWVGARDKHCDLLCDYEDLV